MFNDNAYLRPAVGVIGDGHIVWDQGRPAGIIEMVAVLKRAVCSPSNASPWTPWDTAATDANKSEIWRIK